jgi:bifunctional DNA-binding transcriptional regulator/antitoxin component of YhaV-PrlF toxin-antitoxin module
MSTLKLHYEGWLALPVGLRQKLGLKSGDRLEAELAGGAQEPPRARQGGGNG